VGHDEHEHEEEKFGKVDCRVGQPQVLADGPGLYAVTNRVAVDPTDRLAGDVDVIQELEPGTLVRVVCVVLRSDEAKVRARLDYPEGWISLHDTSDGFRWAIRHERFPRLTALLFAVVLVCHFFALVGALGCAHQIHSIWARIGGTAHLTSEFAETVGDALLHAGRAGQVELHGYASQLEAAMAAATEFELQLSDSGRHLEVASDNNPALRDNLALDAYRSASLQLAEAIEPLVLSLKRHWDALGEADGRWGPGFWRDIRLVFNAIDSILSSVVPLNGLWVCHSAPNLGLTVTHMQLASATVDDFEAGATRVMARTLHAHATIRRQLHRVLDLPNDEAVDLAKELVALARGPQLSAKSGSTEQARALTEMGNISFEVVALREAVGAPVVGVATAGREHAATAQQACDRLAVLHDVASDLSDQAPVEFSGFALACRITAAMLFGAALLVALACLGCALHLELTWHSDALINGHGRQRTGMPGVKRILHGALARVSLDSRLGLLVLLLDVLGALLLAVSLTVGLVAMQTNMVSVGCSSAQLFHRDSLCTMTFGELGQALDMHLHRGQGCRRAGILFCEGVHSGVGRISLMAIAAVLGVVASRCLPRRINSAPCTVQHCRGAPGDYEALAQQDVDLPNCCDSSKGIVAMSC